MEHDCTEPNDGDHSPSGGDSSPSMQELANLLNSWSPQIISQNVQLSNDFHTVLATNASFKQEVRSELDELRAMISGLKNPTVATSAPVSTQSNQVSLVPDQASTTVPITPSPSTPNDSLSSSLSANPTDQQSQMMMIFANSMAKLSFVLSDKSESKSDWPDRSFFETLQPASGTVLLGDGVTTLSIQGVGSVRCKVGPNVLHIRNVQFIPDLSESIYSLFQHIQTKEHGLESSYDDGLFIIFPSFRMKAIIGTDDIYLDFLPDTDSTVDSSSTSTSINSPSLEK